METTRTLEEVLAEVKAEYWRFFSVFPHSLHWRAKFEEAVAKIRLAYPQESPSRLFAEEILGRIVTNETNMALHFADRDYEILAEELLKSIKNQRFSFKTIFCPAYGGYLDNNEWVYDMSTLTDDVPWTAKNAWEFLLFVSQFCQQHDVSIQMQIFMPKWETTRNSHSSLNGGISQEEALALLKESAEKTRRFLLPLGSKNFTIKVKLLDPPDFHSRARERSETLLLKAAPEIAKLAAARTNLYGNSGKEEAKRLATRDLAEAQIGWETMMEKDNESVIIVFTSPKIAHLCLSAKSWPWFQQRTRYQG